MCFVQYLQLILVVFTSSLFSKFFMFTSRVLEFYVVFLAIVMYGIKL